MGDRSYILVHWRHTSHDDPIELWSELDAERYEIRKVEVWQDGRVGFASADLQFGATTLGERPVPSLQEIATDAQFEAAQIDEAAFEVRWRNRYLTQGIEERIERVKLLKADLIADVSLYTLRPGERELRLFPGFGCPVVLSADKPVEGFETIPLLGDEPLNPGESRQIGFAFLIKASADKVNAAGRFFLWAGRAFGEAQIVR